MYDVSNRGPVRNCATRKSIPAFHFLGPDRNFSAPLNG